MNQTPSQDIKLLLWHAIMQNPKEFTPSKIVKTKNAEIKQFLAHDHLLNFRSKGQVLYLSANDKTWQWAEENLHDEFKSKGQAAFDFLNALRVRVAYFMQARGIRLAELFSDDPSQLIRTAYLSLTSGQFDVRVRLRDLRSKLPGLSRIQQDETLLTMQRDGWLGLMSNDDPMDRNDSDEAAALIVGDRHRDLVYLHSEQRV